MEYKIIYEDTYYEIQKEINNHIKDGWIPQGGLCITNHQVAQAMIKTSKETEKIDTSSVTRVEVIQHSPPYNGRAYTKYNAKDVEIQFQDENRTLKIFLK
jgi:hypothetical protein